jgi:hypothetical protein
MLLDPVVARRVMRRRIEHPAVRYRAGKLAGFGEAFVVFAGLALIFSDRLQGLTIAFGLAGAEPPADEGGAR